MAPTADAATPWQLTFVAGTGTPGAPRAGNALASSLNYAEGLASDGAGDFYIADAGNNVIEKVTPAGVLSVVAGTGVSGSVTPGAATASDLGYISAIASDAAGNLYLADQSNNLILKVSSGGVLSVIAGTGSETRAVNGPALSSGVAQPQAIAVDSSGNVYANAASDNAHGGSYNSVVVQISPGGTLTIFAGQYNDTSIEGYPYNGPALSAEFLFVAGLAVDSAGALFILDGRLDSVFRVTGGVLSRYAGYGSSSLIPVTEPGAALDTILVVPQSIAVDSAGDLLIGGNGAVYLVDSSGYLRSIAGDALAGPPHEGAADATTVGNIHGVTRSAQGRVLLLDADYARVDSLAEPANAVPAVTAASPPSAAFGSNYSYTFTTTGYPAPTFQVASGALPQGLSLDSATGVVSGQLLGTGTFKIAATNSLGTATTAAMTVTGVMTAPVITAGAPPVEPDPVASGSVVISNGEVSYWFKAPTANPAATFAVASGSLPGGMALSASGHLDGYPTTSGTFTVSASNPAGTAYAGPFTVHPRPSAPVYSFVSPATGTVGQQYSYSLATYAYPAATYAVTSGQLPSGLALDATTGVLSGSPAGSGRFTITATNSVGTTSIEVPFVANQPASRFTAITPCRVFDTRASGRGCAGAPSISEQPIGPGQTLVVSVAGVAGVPSNATAVVLNVTAIGTGTGTFITAYPDGADLPESSSLNVAGTAPVPNLVTVPVGPGGKIDFYNSQGKTNLIADITGYFAEASGAGYTPVTPCRAMDTRGAIDSPCADVGVNPTGSLGPKSTRSLVIAGQDGVPADATAVVFNLTAAGATAATFVSAYPTGATRPLTSNLNVLSGDVIANLVTVPIGSSGAVTFYNEAGSVDLIADIAGYYEAGSGSLYYPLTPCRMYDTRSGVWRCTPGPQRVVASGQPLQEDDFLSLQIPGISSIPVGATAVVMNVTAVGASAPTFISVFPDDVDSLPTISNLNVHDGNPRPNQVIVQIPPGTPDDVSSNGFVDFYNRDGSVNVIADLEGYYSGSVASS